MREIKSFFGLIGVLAVVATIAWFSNPGVRDLVSTIISIGSPAKTAPATTQQPIAPNPTANAEALKAATPPAAPNKAWVSDAVATIAPTKTTLNDPASLSVFNQVMKSKLTGNAVNLSLLSEISHAFGIGTYCTAFKTEEKSTRVLDAAGVAAFVDVRWYAGVEGQLGKDIIIWPKTNEAGTQLTGVEVAIPWGIIGPVSTITKEGYDIGFHTFDDWNQFVRLLYIPEEIAVGVNTPAQALDRTHEKALKMAMSDSLWRYSTNQGVPDYRLVEMMSAEVKMQLSPGGSKHDLVLQAIASSANDAKFVPIAKDDTGKPIYVDQKNIKVTLVGPYYLQSLSDKPILLTPPNIEDLEKDSVCHVKDLDPSVFANVKR